MRKILPFLLGLFLITACGDDEENNTFENGDYEAQEAEFGHGWKGFLKITISDDELTAVDFDYFDESGNLKSETTTENYPMDPHPTVWLPEYEAKLMAVDIVDFSAVDGVTGATSSGNAVNKLMEAVLNAAKEGDNSIQVVE